MNPEFDIVIVGGGLVGATLACALGGADLKVAVVERMSPQAPPSTGVDVRVSALTLASQRILEGVGAWPHSQSARLAPVRALQIWEAAGGRGGIRYDAADIGEPNLAYIVENSVAHAALLARLQQFTNVHWICPVAVTAVGVTESSVVVTLADGRGLRTRLLVGADGPDSAVRVAAGIGTHVLDFKQKAIVAWVATELPHGDTAWQRFLPTGPLAFLPLADARMCSIVWSADAILAEELMALTEPAFCARLQEAFDERLGTVQLLGARAAFPLVATHARAYVAARVALIGDAAHSVHPLAGQGVNLGMLDAAVLAEVVRTAHRQKKDIGAFGVLRRYERWRKADNVAMLAATTGLKYLFGNDLPLASSARAIGMRLANRATPIKNIIMRRVSGLDGDLPALARRGSLKCVSK